MNNIIILSPKSNAAVEVAKPGQVVFSDLFFRPTIMPVLEGRLIWSRNGALRKIVQIVFPTHWQSHPKVELPR